MKATLTLIMLLMVNIEVAKSNIIVSEISADTLQAITTPADTIHKSLGLKEITVKGRRMIRMPDKDVWFVNKSLRERAFNTVEMLGNIPGMHYVKYDDELTYMGLDKIKILLDGKEKEDGYIRRLANIRYKQVEITLHHQGLYNEYDVLINLVTKENFSGIEGNSNINCKLRPAYEDNTGTARTNQSLTYTYKKINIATEYDFDYRHLERIDEDITRIYPKYSLNAHPWNGPAESFRYRTHTWWIGGDYDINKRHSISVKYRLASQNNCTWADFDTEYAYPTKSVLRRELTRSNDGLKSQVASLFYNGNIKGWKLYTSVHLNWQNSDNDYRFGDIEHTISYSQFNNSKFYTKIQSSVSKYLDGHHFI